MPYKKVKQYSDRGSLSDLVNTDTNVKVLDETNHLNGSELRLKKLYEYAQTYKDTAMQSALGFITTDYIADKNALPLSVYRIRKIVDDIKSKSGEQINILTQRLSGYMKDEISSDTIAFLENKRNRLNIKIASVRKSPSFWRAKRL